VSLDVTDRIVDEVEEFLTGSRGEVEADRVLATVLFTDIVDSTKRASELGDRRPSSTATTRQCASRSRGSAVVK
jgi:class 3 adenylate cyclase